MFPVPEVLPRTAKSVVNPARRGGRGRGGRRGEGGAEGGWKNEFEKKTDFDKKGLEKSAANSV